VIEWRVTEFLKGGGRTFIFSALCLNQRKTQWLKYGKKQQLPDTEKDWLSVGEGGGDVGVELGTVSSCAEEGGLNFDKKKKKGRNGGRGERKSK